MCVRLPCLSIYNIGNFWLINGFIDWIGHKLINAAGYMINILVRRQLNSIKSAFSRSGAYTKHGPI